MKIVHVINSLGTGGAERFVVDLANYGIKTGHSVTLVLLSKVEGMPHSLAEKYQIPIKVIGNSMKDPRSIWRLRKITDEADIVHVHLFPALYWSAFISRPKVFTEHSSQNRRMNKSLWAKLERWVYVQYDGVIVISKGVKQALKQHVDFIRAEVPIMFAQNGTTDEFFSLQRKYAQDPSRLAIVGSLKPVKQHEIAIRAISLLDNVTLDIAGDGPLRAELEELVSQLGLQSRVSFLGNIENIPALLQKTDLLLSTSKYEGMSTVAIEAQASGIPVVGPNVPGVQDVVINGKTGLLYAGHEPNVVAKTIMKALSNPTYLELAVAARKHSEKYSIENSFNAQMRVYESVLLE